MTEQQQQQPESHLWSLHAASGDAAPEESSPRGRFTSKWSNKLMFQALGMKCSLLSQQFPYQEVTLKRSWLQEEPRRNTRWKCKQHFPSLTRSPISLLFPSLLPNHSGILSVRARTKGRQSKVFLCIHIFMMRFHFEGLHCFIRHQCLFTVIGQWLSGWKCFLGRRDGGGGLKAETLMRETETIAIFLTVHSLAILDTS